MAVLLVSCSATGYFVGYNSAADSQAIAGGKADALVLANYRPDRPETAIDVHTGKLLRRGSGEAILELDNSDVATGRSNGAPRVSDFAQPVPFQPVQDEHLLMLDRKLGRIRAELAVLNAVGFKLVHLAEMQDGEFDFQACSGGAATSSGPSSRANLPIENHLESEIALLFPQLDHMNTQLTALEAIFAERRSISKSWPSGIPVLGATAANVSSPFGYRVRSGSSHRRLHRGLDIAAASGSPVLAMATGIVTHSEGSGNYGNLIEIDHGNGYKTRYGHNRENLVAVGSMVRKGQMIARVGTTGRSTGPHVHVEVLEQGERLDPQLFLHLR